MSINKNKKMSVILATLIFLTVIFLIFHAKSKNLVSIMTTDSRAINKLSVLTANVGNLSIGCMDVLNKLCYKDVEERITQNIKLLKPDIVALQEVLPPWQCKTIRTKNKNKVCYDQEQLIPQVRRLLGDQYTIVCTNRDDEGRQFECIAVHTEIGNILGCEEGDLCNIARTSNKVDGCDNGFTVSAATVKLKNSLIFDVVNFHPQSTNADCRARMIATAFEGNNITPPLIQEERVLLLGDFNLDPWRDSDKSVTVWKEFFTRGWGGREFVYHSGIAENDPPYYTSFLLLKKRSPDMVVSNFAQGVCKVLGESPGTTRLDGGKGTDHRALFGLLTFQP